MADDNGKSLNCEVIHCLNKTRFFFCHGNELFEIYQDFCFYKKEKKMLLFNSSFDAL